MWSKKLKDKKIRQNFNNKEFRTLPLLFLMSNVSVDGAYRFSLSKKFLSFNKNFFKTQAKNRCTVSLRSRSPLRTFRLSRIVFRGFASSGALLGIKKSS
jgi:ribosomal protein S14